MGELMLFLKICGIIFAYVLVGYLAMGLAHRYLFVNSSIHPSRIVFFWEVIFWPPWLILILLVKLIYRLFTDLIIPAVDYIHTAANRQTGVLSAIKSIIDLLKAKSNQWITRIMDLGRSGFGKFQNC